MKGGGGSKKKKGRWAMKILEEVRLLGVHVYIVNLCDTCVCEDLFQLCLTFSS